MRYVLLGQPAGSEEVSGGSSRSLEAYEVMKQAKQPRGLFTARRQAVRIEATGVAGAALRGVGQAGRGGQVAEGAGGEQGVAEENRKATMTEERLLHRA